MILDYIHEFEMVWNAREELLTWVLLLTQMLCGMPEKNWTEICKLGFILDEMQENYWSRTSNIDSVLVLAAQWNAEELV
jgi:hypothetical protein